MICHTGCTYGKSRLDFLARDEMTRVDRTKSIKIAGLRIKSLGTHSSVIT